MILRHPTNPILTAASVPYPAILIFNAGVTKYNGRYVLVFRGEVKIYNGAADTVECLAATSVDDLLALCLA
jgi:predicted GH43/DUF377 family glycosyl hydrolase